MKTMWINQPSTLQAYHEYHGINVWANMKPYFRADSGRVYVDIYLLDGSSMIIDRNALSEGWRS